MGLLAVVLWGGRHMAFVGGTAVREGGGDGEHCMAPWEEDRCKAWDNTLVGQAEGERILSSDTTQHNMYMNNHFKRCLERQGNTTLTQQKGKATQHNSPETVIFQRKIGCLGWDSNPQPSAFQAMLLYSMRMMMTMMVICIKYV